MSEQPGRYQRSAGGMIGAMLVLVALIVAFVVFRDLNRDDPPNPVTEVSYAQDAEFARELAGFDLVAPESLPTGWRATTVDYAPGPGEHWHLGMLTDENRYVGLEQSAAPVRSMVETHVDKDATRGLPVVVGDRPWQTWTDAGGDLALVRRAGGTTTLVVGHEVPEDDVVELVTRLR